MIRKPIEPGYYAMVAAKAYERIEHITDDMETQGRFLSAFSRSPSAMFTQEHGEIDGVFWVWKIMRGGWILLMMADRDHCAQSPGEAYQKLLDDLEFDGFSEGDISPFSVMWVQGIPAVQLH